MVGSLPGMIGGGGRDGARELGADVRAIAAGMGLGVGMGAAATAFGTDFGVGGMLRLRDIMFVSSFLNDSRSL